MCGICGVVGYNQSNTAFNKEIVQKMCSEMKHRGPDDEGLYINNNSGRASVGLGHRRLSIIDLSPSGHQPMSNEDKGVWIVLNGEIYNYHELRIDLENKGHAFRSQTDTEIIIHLYEEYGQDCVKFLHGMFAFAIWDEKNEMLFLARDRVGKKPLIYYYQNNRLCFASEFCALLASGVPSKEINPQAIDYYLTYGYIPAPLTIYKDIFKLPPAHTIVLRNNSLNIEKYWDLDYSRKIKISEQEAVGEILRLLKEAVKIRLYSDVPLGAFLSGGIDSSTVVALMSQLSGNRIKTFSIGFQEKDYSELRYARNIAERFDTDHHEFIVKPKALEILPLLVERYGEPYADSSCIPTYYVSKETRQYVTVALNGDGGDELFAGYERYQAMLLADIYQKMPNFAKRIIGSIASILPDSVNSKNKSRRIKRFIKGAILPYRQRYLKWVGIFDDRLKIGLYSQNFSHLVPNPDAISFIEPFLGNSDGVPVLDTFLRTDTMTYLPNDLLVKMDITSMANSLEARSPFLDHKLMEFVARLPAEYKMKNLIKKYILKKAIKGLVPAENIYRRKMGFGVPVGSWLRSELKELLYSNLLSERSFKRGYFNHKALECMVKEHVEKRQDFTAHLWALLMLELWHQRFID